MLHDDRRVALDDGKFTTLSCWGESGPAILCVHGITSSRMGWERFAQHFAATYRVFAYDQRGHGDSAAIRGPMTLEQSLADLGAVLREIGEPVHALVGHSWGGAVVLLGGARYAPDLVVAVDPMIHVRPGTFFADYVDELREVLDLPSAARTARIRDDYSALPPVEIEAKVHAMRSMSIDPLVALGEENGVDDGRWDLRASLRDYPKPLLVLLADPSDSVVSPEDAEDLRNNGGSNVRVEVFEGEGHSLQRTAFDRFTTVVEPFLAS